jgi:hypothetical protein
MEAKPFPFVILFCPRTTGAPSFAFFAKGGIRRTPFVPQPATNADGSATLPFVIPTVPRISYYAAPEIATCAAFIEESRMRSADPTKLDRKFGGSGGICSSLNQQPTLLQNPKTEAKGS